MTHRTATGLLTALAGNVPGLPDLDDAALVARFNQDRDEAAFAELVRRHGPMVLGVCRRAIGHATDAEDAFQAVFLIFARKAGGLAQPNLVGPWLYRVAVRVAVKARRVADRRRGRELLMANLADMEGPPSPSEPDIGPALDRELGRLPEWYRIPILLCDVQGLSRAEAARRLEIPEGTLSSRLANGRKKLADRLARRGIVPAAAVAVLTERMTAGVPRALVESTVRSVFSSLSGGPVGSGIEQLAVEGGMTMRKVILTLAVSTVVVGLAWTAMPADEKPAAPKEAVGKKGEDGKVEAVAKRVVGFEKPVMKWSAKLHGPPRQLIVGGDAQKSAVLLRLEVKPASEWIDGAIIQFEGDKTEGLESLPLGDLRVVDMFPSGKAIVTAQIESEPINAIRELRFWKIQPSVTRPSNADYKQMSAWFALDEKMPSKDPLGPVQLDESTGDVFKLTPDTRGIWNTYTESDDRGIVTKSGLRLINPLTGKTVRSLEPVKGKIAAVHLAANGQFALAVPGRESSSPITEAGGAGLVCWDLVAGKIAWSVPIQVDTDHLVAVARQARIGVIETRTVKSAPKDPKNNPLNRDPYYESSIRLVDIGTNKVIRDLPVKDRYPLAISDDGRLLAVAGDVSTGPNERSSVIAIWDTVTGKQIQRWFGVATVAFLPGSGKVRMVIAEGLGNNAGRIGLWEFEPIEEATKK